MATKKANEIVKANALIEASYRLSVEEQRIILACIAQVRRGQSLTDQQLYVVSAKQVSELSGTNINTTYRDLKAVAERLFERRVMLYEAPNGKGEFKARLTRWVQEVAYYRNKGQLGLRFATALIPYLSQLTSHFTHYALSDVARMTSSHAIRIYELLIQWQNLGEREIPLDWLQECLELKGCYPVFKDFKRRVIVPAVNQINTLSPLKVAWQPIKTGRKITALHFAFKRQEDKAKRVLTRSSDEITRQEIERSAKPGESYEQATQRIRRERLRKARADKPTRPAKLEHKPA